MLYLVLNKALYGCVQSALLWYKMLSSFLINIGFELNPCDLCVVNKVIDGTRCTIVWYVDDTKISHKKPEVVKSLIKELESKFSKMSSISHGPEYDFLGIKLKFEDKKVQIDMRTHLKKAVEDFGQTNLKPVNTPARNNLRKIDDESPKVSEERRARFHSIVMLLICVAIRGRRDMQPAISFLSQRVNACTEEDWDKLKRLIYYIVGTMNLMSCIGAMDFRVDVFCGCGLCGA